MQFDRQHAGGRERRPMGVGWSIATLLNLPPPPKWQNLIRKWRELTRFFVRANATAPCCITFSLQRRAPPFLVRASGAVALKVAEVSSTEKNAKNLVTLPL